jgi:choline dehydrogenase-like flavoprotein
MIISSESLPAQSQLDAKICIIDAGAAGIALACELDGSGFQVLLLEAGALQIDPALDSYYEGTASAAHPDTRQFRRIVFGGTTGIWGGRCVPFDPIDFERREYIANSGWPISYEEVARYYPRALEYCHAGTFDFSVAGSLTRPDATIEGFDGGDDILTDRIERYSLPTDFGKSYRAQIERSANVTALLRARCVKVSKSPGEDRIEYAEIIDAADRTRRVSAEIFVLAVGGVETPRLLFAADPNSVGLGNLSDRLGRYYACHFENSIGRLVPHGARVAFNFEKTKDHVYCRRKLQFSAPAQHRQRLLNTAFRLHFPEYSDATHGSSVMSAIYLAKSQLIPEYRAILAHNAHAAMPSPRTAHVRNVLADLPGLFGFACQWLFKIRLAQRKLPYTLVANADGSFPLEFNCEQTPSESNRVTLGREVDVHGLPRVNIQWRIADDDIEAAARGFHLLRDSINQSAARLEFDEAELRPRLRHSVPLGGHHIGTARMASSSSQGVVDTNSAVFGLRNLYIASSAVFPTSSHANPTLTIVALALRLAAHLKAVA